VGGESQSSAGFAPSRSGFRRRRSSGSSSFPFRAPQAYACGYALPPHSRLKQSIRGDDWPDVRTAFAG
jgi:hypothetical protein